MQTQTMLSEFDAQGFVIIEDVLDLERDLQPLVADYSQLLAELAERYYDEGRLTSDYHELPFSQRYVKLMGELGPGWFQHFDITLPQSQVTAETPIHLSKPVFDLLRNPRLLDIVEAFIGPEIYVSPVQHARIKPPEETVTQLNNPMVNLTRWHQDQGVILPEADESLILTVWLPVIEATVQNGCLCVVPGSHRNDLLTHCVTGQVHIPDQLLAGLAPDAQPLPMKVGSVLFMHRRTVHSSLPNRSSAIRWSFDLRYQPIGVPSGRPAFPGFIARSRRNPASVLDNFQEWANLWLDARARLAEASLPRFNRWSSDSPACA